MLFCMTDLLGLLLSTILVLLIELIESALEHLVDILRYINVYVLLLYGTGYVFSQGQPDSTTGVMIERVFAYSRRNFTHVQQRYTVTERELLAVVFVVGKL